MKVALIDYGAGNLHSVEKALRHLGAHVERAARPEALQGADAAILPGVGAFDDCLNALGQRQLLEATRRYIGSQRPFLGICVGYQALFEKSDEFNSCAAGLGIFQGRVVKFSGKGGVKVPQIGWNQLELVQPRCPLFAGIPNGTYFYFVHSFYPEPRDPAVVAARTEYGERFASAIWSRNLFATQFHPEKSQKAGLRLLHNFLEYAADANRALAGGR